MTTAFTGSSRLANLRERKTSGHEDPLNTQGEFKLTLPEKQEKPTSYEPSSTFNNTKTSMRLLKGRIERGQSNEKSELRSTQSGLETQPKLTLSQKPADLKLVIHDSPQLTEKKVATQVMKPPPKRILIAKQPPKEEAPKEEIKPKVEQVKQVKPQKEEPKQQYVNSHDEKPIIREEDVEDSKEQPEENENDLVICPEGCGRKFNRKALEKHAKACKIVFMSKRKEFNSEAKRLTSKQQAVIVKQNKLKQKNQLGKTKSKGFEKTGQNWKAASEDFRAAIKAVKKQEGDGEQEEAALKLVSCEFCQKMFAQVLLEKHQQNCVKKKEKEKKKLPPKKK